jgi:cation:H+ antiporter
MIGVLQFILGVAGLIMGAHLVVTGASRLALALGVRPLVLGLTVVSIGTSMPELAIGITASFQGSGALAAGNIIGANIFNLLFILGMSALLKPLPLHLQILKLELPVSVATLILLAFLAWDGALSPLDGGVLSLCAVIYTFLVIRMSQKETRAVKREFIETYGRKALSVKRGESTSRHLFCLLMLMVGFAFLAGGASCMVDGAVEMARRLGVSETLIGLTIVTFGTSSPELVTTLIATWKNERDIAVGNLIGSSIYNILVILGITSLVSPVAVPVARQLLEFDLLLLGGVMIACIPVFLTGHRISRLEGGLFAGTYLGYLAALALLRS